MKQIFFFGLRKIVKKPRKRKTARYKEFEDLFLCSDVEDLDQIGMQQLIQYLGSASQGYVCVVKTDSPEHHMIP